MLFLAELYTYTKWTVHLILIHSNLYIVQDEIQKRPRISTLLETLSKYEAVASPQEVDDDGEAKETKTSQVWKGKRIAEFELETAILSIYVVFGCILAIVQLIKRRVWAA